MLFEAAVDSKTNRVVVNSVEVTKSGRLPTQTGIVVREPRVARGQAPRFARAEGGHISVATGGERLISSELMYEFSGRNVRPIEIVSGSAEAPRLTITPVICEGDVVEFVPLIKGNDKIATQIQIKEPTSKRHLGVIVSSTDEEYSILPIEQRSGGVERSLRAQQLSARKDPALISCLVGIVDSQAAPEAAFEDVVNQSIFQVGDVVEFSEAHFPRRTMAVRLSKHPMQRVDAVQLAGLLAGSGSTEASASSQPLQERRTTSTPQASVQFIQAKGPDGTRGFKSRT